MASTSLFIYSNDGETLLYSNYTVSLTAEITITSTGIADYYTYDGDKPFLGFADTPNATIPNYPVGTTMLATDLPLFYIVEGDPTPTDEVTIEYNNAVIASLKAGQSASLSCKDTLMHSDVVVTVPEGMGAMEVVTYNGENVVSGGETLISFTINDTSYQAVEGMTWGEWVESEYNTGGWAVQTTYLGKTIGRTNTEAVSMNGAVVVSTDVIVSGTGTTVAVSD